MSTIDDILIERVFSPITGFLQHRFGVSQWRLSMLCIDGNIAFYLAGVAFGMIGKGMGDAIFADMLAGFGWLCAMSFLRSVAHRQAGSSIGVQSARLGEWLYRTLLVAALPLSLLYIDGLSGFCYSASLVFLILHLYSKASDTPPPRTARKLAFGRA